MKLILGNDRIELRERLDMCSHIIDDMYFLLSTPDDEDSRDFDAYDLIEIKSERLYDETFNITLMFNDEILSDIFDFYDEDGDDTIH